MKKIFTLVAAAVVAITATGQEKEWNISNFEAGEFTTETTIDGLTIYATESGSVAIDGNKKTVDGVEYTKRLKTGGAGSFKDNVYSRVISFDVPSNGTITVITTSSNSDDTRVVGVSFGEFIAFPKDGDNPAGLYSFDVAPGNPQVKSVKYEGGEATKVYIYSKSGGVNFYDFKFTPAEGGGEVGGGSFEWQPFQLYPSPSSDIMVADFMGNVTFKSYIGEAPATDLKATDVMPVWIDEDGNEIKATSVNQDPYGWDASEYAYTFDVSGISENGEYTLLFPEGMLVNADGVKSAEVKTYYTLNDADIAPAMFPDFEVLSIVPELSQPQSKWDDKVVTLNTNHNDAIGLTTLRIEDTTTGDVVCTSSNFSVGRELGSTEPISWEVTGSYQFFEEHIYRAEFIFYNGKDEVDENGNPTKVVAKATYDFTGLVETYKYSSVKLENVTPNPVGYVISDPSQAVFTYTFSGPVTVYMAYSPLGQNGQKDYPESCLSSNEEKTVWTLDLSGQDFIKTLDAALPISIRARDLDGNQLQGNFGEETLSSFEYEWECEIGAPEIVIVTPTNDASVEKLTEVIVKSADGEAMKYQGWPAATIQSRDRQQLGELYLDFEAAESAEVRFTEWIPTGEWTPQSLETLPEGIYSLVFPHGAFQFGDQLTAKQSHSAGTSFEISGGAVTPPSEQATFEYVSVDPASGSTVTSLDKIVITFAEVAGLTEFTINVYKEGVEEPIAVADLEYDPEDWNAIDVNFREPITADGTYTLTFKEGVICDEAYDASQGASGTCNPEFKLTYTIGDDNAVDAVEAADADAVIYDLTGRRVLNPNKGIYIINGKKVIK